LQLFRAARPGVLEAVSGAAPAAAAAEPIVGTSRRPKAGTVIIKKISQGLFHKQSREAVKKAVEKLTEGLLPASRLKIDGDRDALEKRHKDFVHLHNAQVDSPSPLTMEQVVTEVHRREAARNVETKRTGKTDDAVDKMKNGEVIHMWCHCVACDTWNNVVYVSYSL
jgi:hypothetical protein